MSAKQVRQGQRLAAQNELKNVKGLLSATPLDRIRIEKSVRKLEVYCKNLQMSNATVLSFLAEQGAKEEEVSKDVQESLNYEEALVDQIAEAQAVISAIDRQQQAQASPAKSPPAAVAPAKPPLRLPKLEIAQFSGKQLEWQGFFDSFESSIHNNAQLSDIDKFNYLKGLLSGEAKRVIEGYRLTSSI